MKARITCTICGYSNDPEAKLCAKCQSVLGVKATTHLIEQPDEKLVGVPRYGRANIERTLFLHVRGSNEPIQVVLEDREMIIGRFDPSAGKAPDIDLANYDAEGKGVSRRHARLIYRAGSLKISDLNSSNHTYLNGQKLVAEQNRILRDGDEIQLGQLIMTVQFGERNVG